MEDTPTHIHQKQLEIILSKTMQERLAMGLQMMEDTRLIVMRGIRQQNPGISETEVKIEFIKRYYKDDFTPEYMEDVIRWFRQKSEMP